MPAGPGAITLLVIGELDFEARLVEALGRVNYRVTVRTVTAGDDALAELDNQPLDVDCVLCHHQPARIEALSVLDTIREERPSLPFVVYATQSDATLANRVLDRDGTGYVARDSAASDRAILVAEAVRATLDRQQTATALQEHQESRETIDDVLSDAVWEWDPSADTLTLSPAFVDVFDVESGANPHTAEWWVDRVHPNDRAKLVDLKEALESGELDRFERLYRFRRADGTYSHVLSRGRVRTRSDDGPRVYGVLIELDQQIEYLARFHELVEYSVDTMSIVAADGTVNYVSPSVETISGRDADAVIGENLRDYVHPEDREILTEALDSLHETTEYVAGPVEYRIEDGQGGWLWVESVARAPHEDLRIDGYVMNTRIITRRKEQEQELRRFQLLVEQAGTAIYITDEDGIIEYVNPAFERITGFSAADAIRETPAILSSGDQEPEYYRRLWETISGGDVWKELIIDRKKSGERYTAVQTIAPIQSPRDGISGYVAIQNDVSGRKLNTQRLEVLNRVLRHNLRNNLTVIEGHVDVLAEAAGDDQAVQPSVEAVSRAIETLITETEKARDIQETLQQKLYADGPVRDVIDTLEATTERFPDAEVVFDPIEGADANVHMVVARALTELLENAILHNDREPHVTVSAAASGEDDVEFRIADNGPGLPEIERAVLEDGTEDRLHHGGGLGLWIAYWLVQISGGRIEFDENEPRGTIVSVFVPRK